jgi:hypothetical protein
MEATLEQRMLADTLGAFDQFDQESTAVISPERGLLLVEGWLNALRGDVGAERVRAELEVMRDCLASDTPDLNKIRHLLLSMASHTAALAGEPSVGSDEMASQLRHLANILRTFSSQF